MERTEEKTTVNADGAITTIEDAIHPISSPADHVNTNSIASTTRAATPTSFKVASSNRSPALSRSQLSSPRRRLSTDSNDSFSEQQSSSASYRQRLASSDSNDSSLSLTSSPPIDASPRKIKAHKSRLAGRRPNPSVVSSPTATIGIPRNASTTTTPVSSAASRHTPTLFLWLVAAVITMIFSLRQFVPYYESTSMIINGKEQEERFNLPSHIDKPCPKAETIVVEKNVTVYEYIHLPPNSNADTETSTEPKDFEEDAAKSNLDGLNNDHGRTRTTVEAPSSTSLKTFLLTAWNYLPEPINVTADESQYTILTNVITPSHNSTSKQVFPFPKEDIVMVTHTSIGSRLSNLEIQMRWWNGPVAVAIYIKSAEMIEQFCEFVPILTKNNNVQVHIMLEKTGTLSYPHNMLRNLAMQHLTSDYFVAMDADFVTTPDAYIKLFNKIVKPVKSELRKRLKTQTLMVLPAFEKFRINGTSPTEDMLPTTKEQVHEQNQNKTVEIFHRATGYTGHRPTNFLKWFENGPEPFYEIKYENNFEPYVLGFRPGIPMYWNDFRGFGYNKMTWFAELNHVGYRFCTLRDFWVIHINHAVVKGAHDMGAKNRPYFRQFKNYLGMKEQNPNFRTRKGNVPVPAPAPVPDVQQEMTNTTEIEPGRINVQNSPSSATNYYTQPLLFVDTLKDCMEDEYCHIYYHHVMKTGGTGVEDLFYGMFKKGHHSCCLDRLMRKFRDNPVGWCKDKFLSVQVYGNDFTEILNKCMEIHSQNTTHPRRAVAMTSFREPIALTLSHIHQICNKSWKHTPKHLQQLCKRCNYTADEDIWLNEVVNSTNRVFDNVFNDVLMQPQRDDVQVLGVDLMDMDALFRRLHDLSPQYNYTFNNYWHKKHNPEKLGVCTFSINSAMLKTLQYSIETYRKLSSL